MLKLILLVLAIWLIATIVKRNKQPMDHPPPSKHVDEMVRCATCGIHVPKAESVVHKGRDYCSQVHLEQDLKE